MGRNRNLPRYCVTTWYDGVDEPVKDYFETDKLEEALEITRDLFTADDNDNLLLVDQVSSYTVTDRLQDDRIILHYQRDGLKGTPDYNEAAFQLSLSVEGDTLHISAFDQKGDLAKFQVPLQPEGR